MPSNIALIKIGALGDVVRTTCLLHALEGEVTWITKPNAFSLLEGNPRLKRVVDVAEAPERLAQESFNLVINLDEEPSACALATQLGKNDLIGAYEKGGRPFYTDSSAEWFDMGLISRFGKSAADRKKWENRSSYQEIIYRMVGKRFNGEEYILPPLKRMRKDPQAPWTVGLETRSGDRWIGKRWSRFPELMASFKRKRIPYYKFRTFPTLLQFIRHIHKADAVVTTDSLALHLALGLGKKIVALFTCTSFHEIHGYGRMEKVVSPKIEQFYYSTDPSLESGEAIEPGTVWEALVRLREKEGVAEARP